MPAHDLDDGHEAVAILPIVDPPEAFVRYAEWGGVEICEPGVTDRWCGR